LQMQDKRKNGFCVKNISTAGSIISDTIDGKLCF
jgi:hypothetical protein